jgi:hypothetical protein
VECLFTSSRPVFYADKPLVLAINSRKNRQCLGSLPSRLASSLPVLSMRRWPVRASMDVRIFPTDVDLFRPLASQHWVRGELDWLVPVASKLIASPFF